MEMLTDSLLQVL